MATLLLDADVLIDYLRDHPAVGSVEAQPARCLIPGVTVAGL
jgi:hypothetical protein